MVFPGLRSGYPSPPNAGEVAPFLFFAVKSFFTSSRVIWVFASSRTGSFFLFLLLADYLSESSWSLRDEAGVLPYSAVLAVIITFIFILLAGFRATQTFFVWFRMFRFFDLPFAVFDCATYLPYCAGVTWFFFPLFACVW